MGGEASRHSPHPPPGSDGVIWRGRGDEDGFNFDKVELWSKDIDQRLKALQQKTESIKRRLDNVGREG